MDSTFINKLLHEEEGASLDFKREQYSFDGATDVIKSELLKDILAFANAWRRTEAYILIGAKDVRGGRSIPIGVTTHHDDANLQQFVNSKTNRPVAFSYQTTTIDGIQVGVIRVEVQERPFYLNKNYGKLKAGTVYLRRGSSTDTADPEEVHRMGASSVREEKPRFEEELKVSLQGGGAASSLPPFGTGEPMHLKIDLTIVNTGNAPVFIVAANLRDAKRRKSLDFTNVCNEIEPLQPGGRRKSKSKLLHHMPFPENPRSPRTTDQLYKVNCMVYRMLMFICQDNSEFYIQTGRGTDLIYPAIEVCDENFLGWPYMFPPKNVQEALGSKTLKDFEEEERAAWEKAGAKSDDSQPEDI